MSIPPEYYIIREKQYLEMLAERKVMAETAKQILLELDPKDLATRISESGEEIKKEYLIGLTVYEYFKAAIFFHDSETLKKLADLDLKSQVLKWFIPLSDLDAQYKYIQSNEIKIDVILAFDIIKFYLSSKILKELQLISFPITRDNIVIPQATNELINLKSRRKYYDPYPVKFKTPFQYLINDLIDQFIAIPADAVGMKKFDTKTFIDISRGKTESLFLGCLIKECFEYDPKTITKTKFLTIVYDLFRIILQDHVLITVHDFYFGKNGSYQSYKSFESYQAKKLRAIIYPKRKT